MRISDWSSDLCSSDLILVTAILAATPNSAHAMNWCGLLDIIPREQGDFEKLSGSVEALTGCGSQPSDSAHQAIWACSDDTATEEYEGVHISLFRESGEGTYLLVAEIGRAHVNS